nr:MAG TPA: distal tail protein [Caudoviricetes sp.]
MPYEFIDTIDSSDNPGFLSSEAFSLDGVYPENELKKFGVNYFTLQVSGREALSYDLNKADSISGIDGETLIDKRLPGRELTVKFKIEAADATLFAVAYRQLKGFLQGSERTIKFDDEPNLVYVGTLSEIGAPDPGQIRGINTFTFYCEDVHPSSSFKKIINANTTDENIGSITVLPDKSVDILINNQGTLPAYPTFKFTHTSDNAYIGLAGENGVVALGSQEQYLTNSTTTETTKVESQWLLNPSAISQKNNFDGQFMTANDVPNPQNGQLLTAGNLVWKQDGLRFQDGGPMPPKDTVYLAMGAMQQWTLPADKVGDVGSANFTSTFNIWGQATKQGQTGLLQVLFVGDNNKILCGMGIYKDDAKGNTFQTQLYIGGNHNRTWKVFGPVGQELNNGGHGDGKVPNPNLYFNSTTGYFTIQKKGPVFNFTFGNRGGNYPITIPELAYTKCKKVYVYGGQLWNRNNTDQKITNLSLRMFNFQKNDVTKTIDSTVDATKYIPADNHHYGKYEVVVADMASANIYRKEGATIANDEMITGSEPFSVPVGKSIVNCSFGDGATPPDIEVTLKERYL